MKFSNGIFDQTEDDSQPTVGDVEKNRLFQTVKEETPSERKYLKLFGVVVAVVVAIGLATFYLTLPGVGDKVRAPNGLEDAVRDHFLMKQKRTATDITFYQCGDFYWARVGVETRSDIPNPLYHVESYSAHAVLRGDAWDISAAPITSPEMDAPCK